jgi:hypothetical protein
VSTDDELRRLKELYLPPADRFVLVDVPEMSFVMIEGEGDHSTEVFRLGSRWLFSVLAPIKPVARERMGGSYVEPPLEVLWWADDMRDFIAGDRAKWKWRQMIVMADWVDEDLFDRGMTAASERLGEQPSTLRLDRFDEGRSVQIMHVGPEEAAIPTMARMFDVFLPEHHLVATGSFHEIYLSDPRRVAPEKMRTVLRQPVVPVGEDGLGAGASTPRSSR